MDSSPKRSETDDSKHKICLFFCIISTLNLLFFRQIDYAKNPRVRDVGKSNFNAYKNGNGLGMLLELQGRSFTPRSYKSSNVLFSELPIL